MTPQEKARALRPIIEKAAVSLSDEDAIGCVELFPAWAADADYTTDERIRYGGKLYRCVQAHKSQADWTPPSTPALWTEVAAPGEIPVWRQPTGAQDAYRIGDKVHYPDINGPIYECTSDYNIYPPDQFGWKLVENN